jgi:hypothetical protein
MKEDKLARHPRNTAEGHSAPPTPETIGRPAGKIPVEVSTRFLEHFSEQLYSSPQKAFEELISNGWDAGADCVDVRISADLSDVTATMSVLDNGVSMDAAGLRQLWHIAFSPKTATPFQYGRQVIGKFGIGKLATYVLGRKLTYICKAADGRIRRVTMNYGELDRQKGAAPDRLISEVELEVFEVREAEVAAALESVYDGRVILDLIRKGVPRPRGSLGNDEFGAQKAKLERPGSGTWTLVVLSDLKPTGRALKLGILRRMLEAALPFGSEMAITVNGALLAPSKIDAPVKREWIIGPDLEIDNVEINEGEEKPERVKPAAAKDGYSPNGPGETGLTKIPIGLARLPVPHVELPGIGMVTGRVTLFDEPISGGKSEERGASNGFHINVLGRVVNQSDPSFGEENLSHAAWARFRMTARADGLNAFLTTDREKFRERRELKIFRAFLRRAFNKARTLYDSDENVGMPDGGDVLVRSLGVLSLNPLRNVVSEALSKQSPLPGLFDETGISDRQGKRKSWRENTADNIRNALGQVKYERIDDDSFVKFRIADNTILINKEHPFVAEYSRTKAEKELMRTVAMVSLLGDVYALDIGVPPPTLQNIRDYRDRLMRFRALQQRQSGTYIAKLLLQTQHDSENSKRLEAVLSDALRYLGFQVRDLAKPGEPEGIASAYATPTLSSPTQENPNPPLYSFSFDAKSSKHEIAATGNIKLDGVVEHRERYKANYALVVAPGFSGRAIVKRCGQQSVTPMNARDLGRLLEYTAEYGAIPLTKIRDVFALYDPEAVSKWVGSLGSWLKQKRPLTIDIFLKALENLKGKVPDVLPAGVIAYECRQNLRAVSVMDADVIALARGLSILIPDLVGIDEDKIVVNASAARVAAAVASQLEHLHSDDPVASAEADR